MSKSISNEAAPNFNMEKKPDQPVGSFRSLMKIYRAWRQIRDRFSSALDVDFVRKVEIYTQLSTSATLKDLLYWLQLLFSAGIATLGLVLNSTAVVIGAMLISPLMAPILSQGLALATGDLTLGVRALVNLLLSTLVGVTFAFILVAFLPFNDITSEIRARMEPNTLDLVIALFSGAIGSIAICRDIKGVATSIPGVAIAVALMPPLCVIGFGFGYAFSVDVAKGFEIAGGGGLLYMTNLVAITFTAMLVFVSLRIDTQKVRKAVRTWREKDPESQWWLTQIQLIPALEKAREVRSFSLRLLMIILPLLIIFFPLSSSLSKMRQDITNRQTENRISQTVREIWSEFETDSEGAVRSYLDELRVNDTEEGLKIYLRVFDNQRYTTGERKNYINLLSKALGRKPETISLQLVEIPTSERKEISPVLETTPTPMTIAQTQSNYLQHVSDGLADFKLPQPATQIDYSVTNRSFGGSVLEIFYLSVREIDADGKSALQETVRSRLALPNLTLILTRISSSETEIPFDRSGTKINEEKAQDLFSVANTLNRHPSLKLRLLLRPAENGNKVLEEKKKSIGNFFVKNGNIAEDRLIFGEVGEENPDTMQIFVRN